MMRWKDGQVLVECPLKDPAENDYMSPYWHIHRADLHRGLLSAAMDHGCKVTLNSRVVSIDPSVPTLATQDGKTYSADLIVASDGLHSMAREVILGRASAPIPTGQMAYRVILPVKRLEGIPELEEIISIARNNHWLGPNATILSYLLEGKEEKLLNLVFTCDTNMPDGTNQRIQDSTELRDRFKDWDSRIGMILEHVDTVLEWRLYTHEELNSWIHKSENLCLIGDAAHAMTPYLAQGAAMSIEDAAILGALLEKYPNNNTLPEALSKYFNLRQKRTAMIAKASIESRYFTQMPDGDLQKDRDEYLLTHPGIWREHINIRSRREFLDELFGYDAYKALEDFSTLL
ncbi:988dd662-1f9a-4488-970c-85cb9730d938 [Sclerotinia trifoliorum]|uniref:988dd662-1f9a-4488-970c-85cb9730d938 n=1 Tax=Sclerotinia trifoliorum TaxID=28548 RepID=A0A8H2ZUZ5_9HELO|nr:988dd662-1f9a-4488-970c-85cb9730d938 [Sclerotinia trifoliorum]